MTLFFTLLIWINLDLFWLQTFGWSTILQVFVDYFSRAYVMLASAYFLL